MEHITDTEFGKLLEQVHLDQFDLHVANSQIDERQDICRRSWWALFRLQRTIHLRGLVQTICGNYNVIVTLRGGRGSS